MKEGYVYFIADVPGKQFKIGFSTQPKTRCQSLKNASGRRLELRAVRPGTLQLEKDLHFHFRKQRSIGEWFSSLNLDMELIRFQEWNQDSKNRDIKEWMRERLGLMRRGKRAKRIESLP